MGSSRRGKRSKRAGDFAEQAALMALRACGYQMVEKIHTGWRITSVNPRRGYWNAHVIPDQKVSGDFRAVDVGGVSVLAEVKYTKGDRIQWSRLRSHQVAALNEHAACGGVSLLVVLFEVSDDVYIMRWPIQGFCPGTSLGVDACRRAAINL